MLIKIPARVYRAAHRTLDSVTTTLLPPPRPTGYHLWGVDITWTDIGTAGWAIVLILVYSLWYPLWVSAATVIGTLVAGMALLWPSRR